MPTPEEQAVAILKAEINRLTSLVDLMQQTPGKRGRKADMPIAVSVPRRGQRKFTAAQRKAKAKQMRAYWKAKRAATSGGKGGKKKAAKGAAA